MRFQLLTLLSTLIACGSITNAAFIAIGKQLAPLLHNPGAEVVPGEYVVMYNNELVRSSEDGQRVNKQVFAVLKQNVTFRLICELENGKT